MTIREAFLSDYNSEEVIHKTSLAFEQERNNDPADMAELMSQNEINE